MKFDSLRSAFASAAILKRPFYATLGFGFILIFGGILVTFGYYAACSLTRDDPDVHDDSMRLTVPVMMKELNGYYYLLKARSEMQLPQTGQISNLRLDDFLRTGDHATAVSINNLIRSNDTALRWAEAADRCQRYQKTPVKSAADPFRHYHWLIELQRLRLMRASIWFKQGLQKQAFTEAFHVITVGRRCEDSGGSLTTVAAGITMQRMGWRTLRSFLPHTTLDVTTLHDFLQSGDHFSIDTNGMGNAFRLEYFEAVYVINQKKARRLRLFYNPIPELPCAEVMLKANRTKNKLVQRFQELIDDTNRPFNQQASRKNEDWRRSIWPVLFTTNPVGEATLITLTYGWDLTLAAKCVANIDGAATQTLLALKAWQQLHKTLPERLDDLIPLYLDHLPVDDFTGRPMLYSKSRKVIWSSIEPPVELDRAPAGFAILRDDSLVFRIPF